MLIQLYILLSALQPLTQGSYRAGLLGFLALLRPGPWYLGCQPWTAEVLWRQGSRLRGRWGDMHRGRAPSFLVGVGNLVGVGCWATGGKRDWLTNRGGGPPALARGGGEERPGGGEVGRRTSGGGAAGWWRGGTSAYNWTPSASVWRHNGRWAIVWRERERV